MFKGIGLFLCSIVDMFHYYWCTRKPWSSSIMLYNNNIIAHNHHTNYLPYIHNTIILMITLTYTTPFIILIISLASLSLSLFVSLYIYNATIQVCGSNMERPQHAPHEMRAIPNQCRRKGHGVCCKKRRR